MNSDDEYNDNDEFEDNDENITSEDDESQSSMQIQDSNVDVDKQKAEALKKQIGLWDTFLELRIKLQRAIIGCNCLPTSLTIDDADDEFREVIDENEKLFRKTLALLLAIETRRSSKRTHDDADDNETNNKNDSNTIDIFKSLSKRLKSDEQTINKQLDTSYERLVPERDSVIEKWFERTRAFSKQNKNNTVEQSPLVQIKEIMSMPGRLIKRTQTARIDYDLICPPSSPNNVETSINSINSEIFDDGDFYHQLLREYIERKTASITDPEQISKHWVQLRKLRTKLKKNVDTKASKDRKIRYNVHKKLVNYMAPIDRCSFNDEAKSDLFSSLFGRTTLDSQPTSTINDIRLI